MSHAPADVNDLDVADGQEVGCVGGTLDRHGLYNDVCTRLTTVQLTKLARRRRDGHKQVVNARDCDVATNGAFFRTIHNDCQLGGQHGTQSSGPNRFKFEAWEIRYPGI